MLKDLFPDIKDKAPIMWNDGWLDKSEENTSRLVVDANPQRSLNLFQGLQETSDQYEEFDEFCASFIEDECLVDVKDLEESVGEALNEEAKKWGQLALSEEKDVYNSTLKEYLEAKTVSSPVFKEEGLEYDPVTIKEGEDLDFKGWLEKYNTIIAQQFDIGKSALDRKESESDVILADMTSHGEGNTSEYNSLDSVLFKEEPVTCMLDHQMRVSKCWFMPVKTCWSSILGDN